MNKELNAKLDKVFSRYIKLRDSHCANCRSPTDDTAHLINRTNHIVRWHQYNACGLCRKCHLILEKDKSAHRYIMEKLFGVDAIEKLYTIANQYDGVWVDNIYNFTKYNKEFAIKHYNALYLKKLKQ